MSILYNRYMDICKQLYCKKPVAVVPRNSDGTGIYKLKTCLEHKKSRDESPLGTRKILNTGYVLIKDKSGWLVEHRVAMEKKLGRKMLKGESVHHKNGIKHDNSPDNLELWVSNIVKGQRATDIRCPNCHISYWDTHTDIK